MTIEIIPEDRRAMTRREHDTICGASADVTTKRFAGIDAQLVDGKDRMQRIEDTLTTLTKTYAERTVKYETIAKTQLETSVHVERLDRRLEALSDETGKQLDRIDASLQQHVAMTAENTTTMNEIRDLFITGKGAFKFFSHFGDFLKWGAGIAASLFALWVALKDFRSH